MFVATQWNCPQCATQDISGDVCPNCGWHRDGTNGSAPVAVSPVSPTDKFEYSLTQDVFLLRRRNTNFVMGQSGRLGLRYTLWFVIIGIGGVFLAAVLVSYLLSQWNLVNEVDQTGISVQATVINHRVSTGKNSSYYLTYQYTANERLFQREQNVTSATFNRFPLNSKITVKYLASDPATSLLAGDAADNASLNSLTLVSLMFCAGAFIATFYLGGRMVRYSRMSRDGQLLRGQVVTCLGVPGSKGSWFIELRYSFRTPDGQITEKIEKEVRNDLKKKMGPRPGTPVAVLYVNDRLFEVM